MAQSPRRQATEFIPPLDLKPAQAFITGLTGPDSSQLDAADQKLLTDHFLQALTALGDAFGSSGADKGSMFCRATVEILIEFLVVNSGSLGSLSASEKNKNSPSFPFLFHMEMKAVEVVGELQGRLPGFDLAWLIESATRVLAECDSGITSDDLLRLECQLRRGIVWDCEEAQSSVYAVTKACVAVILHAIIGTTLATERGELCKCIGEVSQCVEQLVTLTNLLVAFAEEVEEKNKEKLVAVANKLATGVVTLSTEIQAALSSVPDVIRVSVQQAIAQNIATVPKDGEKIVEPVLKWISNNDMNLLNTEFESLSSGGLGDIMYWVMIVVRDVFARKYNIGHIRNALRMLCSKCADLESAINLMAKADLEKLKKFVDDGTEEEIGFTAVEFGANLSQMSPDKKVVPYVAEITKILLAAFKDSKQPARIWLALRRCADVCIWESVFLGMNICRDMYNRLKLATEDMAINEKAKSVPYFNHYLEVVMPMLLFDRNYTFPSQLLPAWERTMKIFERSRTFQNYRFQTEMTEAIRLVKWCRLLVTEIAGDINAKSWTRDDFAATLESFKQASSDLSNCELSREILNICALCKCETSGIQEEAIKLASQADPVDTDTRDRIIKDLESLDHDNASDAPLLVVIDSRLEAQARYLPLLVHAKRCEEMRRTHKRSGKAINRSHNEGSDSERIPLLKSSSAVLGGVGGAWITRPGMSLPTAGNTRPPLPSTAEPAPAPEEPRPTITLSSSASIFNPVSHEFEKPTTSLVADFNSFMCAAPVLPPSTATTKPSGNT